MDSLQFIRDDVIRFEGYLNTMIKRARSLHESAETAVDELTRAKLRGETDLIMQQLDDLAENPLAHLKELLNMGQADTPPAEAQIGAPRLESDEDAAQTEKNSGGCGSH